MPRARHIPALLEVHADDLAFLWAQSRNALRSAHHTLREYAELNERIEAHLQGLMVAPPDGLVSLLQSRLVSGDRDEAFAAAYACLRGSDRALTHAVIVEFSRASGATLAGLRDALSLAPPAHFADAMRSALQRAKPITAVAASVVLANHRMLDSRTPRLSEWLVHDDSEVCAPAWGAALAADIHQSDLAPQRPFDRALRHPAATVRHAVWAAAAWLGQAKALPMLRQMATSGDAVAVHWLAVLGAPDDLDLIQRVAGSIDDPGERCRVLARFGHPALLQFLLQAMTDDHAALAHAAGEAFTRMTGVDIRGNRQALPLADDADEFDREMEPLVWMPDPAKAQAALAQHGGWVGGHRWCQGRRVDAGLDKGHLLQLDLDARWDVAARAALAGRPLSAPPPVH